MLVTLNQDDLEQDNLSWLCIKPMLLSVVGKDQSSKSNLYNQLNKPQKALMLFYAFHNHITEVAEFFWYVTYYKYDIGSWNALKEGMRHFEELGLLAILESLESVIDKKYPVIDENWQGASPTELDKDEELHRAISNLYIEYQTEVPEVIKNMNSYIRNNQDLFLRIES